MIQNQPIGIFDSGIGGTSVWKEIHKLLPLEKTIYLADSKNAPYGVKTKEEIIALCKKNTDLLLDFGCKIIVVACNTATTNAIQTLRSEYQIPFIGIEPAIKPAALQTEKKRIGILATKGTLSSELFAQTSAQYAEHIETIEVEGKGLVRAIESGKLNAPSTFLLLKKVLQPILQQDVDYLVLGCTHYPYLIPLLKQILPTHVKIIDSGEAIARQTQSILQEKNQLAKTQQDASIFYTNKDPDILKAFVQNPNLPVSYLDF